MPMFDGFTDSQVEDIKKQAINFWDQSTKMMNPFFTRLNDYDRVSRGQLPADIESAYEEHEDRSCLVPSDIYVNLKSLSAHVHEILFSRKPYGIVTERGKPNIQTDQTQKAQAKLQHMLDVSNFEDESDYAVLQALVAGRTAVFTEWHTDYQKTLVREPQTRQPLTADDNLSLFTVKPVAEYARTVSLDIRRVRIDPSAEIPKDIRLVGYHRVRSVSELLIENGRFYKFKPKDLLEQSFDHDKYYEYVSDEVNSLDNKGHENEEFGDKIVEEIRIYGLFRLENKGQVEFHDLIVSLVNRDMVIGLKRNDLPLHGWELFDWPAIDKEHARMFPMGVVEPAMDAFLEKHVKLNQSIDGTNRDTYDTYLADKSASQELPDTIEHTPEQILKVDLMASGARSVNEVFQPLPRPQRSHDPFVQAATLTDVIQQIMRLSDYIQGLDPSRSETATAVSE